MKKQEVYRLKKGCELVARLGGANFSYTVVKNLRTIMEEMNIYEKIIKMTDEYSKKYQPEIEKLAAKYCIKDPNGQAIPKRLDNGNTVFDFAPDQKILFDKAVAKMEVKPEFKKMVADRKKQLTKYADLMEEELNIKLDKIKRKDIPQEITPAQLDMIFEMIE